jgi:hypothetical protein
MEPASKHPDIRRFQSALMGTDVVESIRHDRCTDCGQPAEVFRNQLSEREFAISGLCQACQDHFFDEEE